MEPCYSPKNKGASFETPSRSPLRAIHLRLADWLDYGRAGLGTQSGFSVAGLVAKKAAPGNPRNRLSTENSQSGKTHRTKYPAIQFKFSQSTT